MTVVIGSTRISHERSQIPMLSGPSSRPPDRCSTSGRSLPAGPPGSFPNNIGVLTIVVRRPVSLVVIALALPGDADRRGSSEGP